MKDKDSNKKTEGIISSSNIFINFTVTCQFKTVSKYHLQQVSFPDINHLHTLVPIEIQSPTQYCLFTMSVSMHRKQVQKQDFRTHSNWSKGDINFDLAYKSKGTRVILV